MRRAERRRILGAQECHRAIGLLLSLQRFLRHRDRIERRFDMRHVHQRDIFSGKHECEAALAGQAVILRFLFQPRRDVRALRLVRLVDPLDDDHLRAVDWAIGGLASGESAVPGERRVAGRINEADG